MCKRATQRSLWWCTATRAAARPLYLARPPVWCEAGCQSPIPKMPSCCCDSSAPVPVRRAFDRHSSICASARCVRQRGRPGKVRVTRRLQEILNTFYSMLERMGQFRRILVFLDSVDQLDSSDGAYHLTWVRTPLPANVKMVVSTLPNMFDLLKTFKGKLPNPDIYVEVTPLETSLCTSILSALLSEQGRTLNEQQWALVEQAFSKCSLPIYVHLLYHEVLRWRSYQQVDESSLRYT
ncbi:hypothetical protein BOX15_Mlig022598g5, partial [Macrostomum lignano]